MSKRRYNSIVKRGYDYETKHGDKIRRKKPAFVPLEQVGHRIMTYMHAYGFMELKKLIELEKRGVFSYDPDIYARWLSLSNTPGCELLCRCVRDAFEDCGCLVHNGTEITFTLKLNGENPHIVKHEQPKFY